MTRLLRAVLRTGTASLVVLDAVRVALSFVAVLLLRFDGDVPGPHWDRFLAFLPVVVGVHLLVSWRFRLYEQVWRHASVDEAVRVVASSGVSLAVLVVADLLRSPRVPVSVVVFGVLMTLLVNGASRFQSRLVAALSRTRRTTGTPVAIIGSGQTAAMLIRSLRDDDTATLNAVVVLTDDEREIGHALMGVPVAGRVDDLPQLAQRHGLTCAVIAQSQGSRELLRRATDAAEAAGIALKIVPDLNQLLGNGRLARIMRDVRIEDLLGREQVQTDLEAVAATIRGRRVLVTGGGGSIGSEIVRQVAALGPQKLVVLDHDETHLFDVASTLEEPCVQVLADIRDTEVIAELFQVHRPEVVFHAAAHKHVPLLEAHPCEAVRTNVRGTQNVFTAAAAVGVDRLVFISTDKAVDPSSVMGASKWIGEQLVRRHAPAGARWCAVRFGNVLGSRGSVLPTFNRQIEAGGPVTVTDPDMTRYFMSTSEAVQLVLQASALAQGTDTFMLEMGEPVNILGLAHKMIRLSGLTPDTDVPVVITGPRPGEKLAEELSWRVERSVPTAHEAITRLEGVAVDELHLAEVVDKLLALADARDDRAAGALLLDVPAQTMLTHSTGDRTWSSANT